jgi:hypothetical protein
MNGLTCAAAALVAWLHAFVAMLAGPVGHQHSCVASRITPDLVVWWCRSDVSEPGCYRAGEWPRVHVGMCCEFPCHVLVLPCPLPPTLGKGVVLVAALRLLVCVAGCRPSPSTTLG